MKTLTRKEFLLQGLFWSGMFIFLFSFLERSKPTQSDDTLKPVKLTRPETLALNTITAYPAYQIWLIRSAKGFYALRSSCTHMGCAPELRGSNFHCPCHHSAFDLEGLRLSGPALRALERYRLFWNSQGEIMLDRSVVYHHEKGEWTLPGAFLPFTST